MDPGAEVVMSIDFGRGGSSTVHFGLKEVPEPPHVEITRVLHQGDDITDSLIDSERDEIMMQYRDPP